MKIDVVNGCIELENMNFYPGMKLDGILELFSACSIKPMIEDMKTGWKWVKVINLYAERKYYNFSLGFKNDKLFFVHFSFSNDQQENDPWKTWSLETEKLKVKNMEIWLNQFVGVERKYTWGEIWNNLDPRNQIASHGISYIQK